MVRKFSAQKVGEIDPMKPFAYTAIFAFEGFLWDWSLCNVEVKRKELCVFSECKVVLYTGICT